MCTEWCWFWLWSVPHCSVCTGDDLVNIIAWLCVRVVLYRIILSLYRWCCCSHLSFINSNIIRKAYMCVCVKHAAAAVRGCVASLVWWYLTPTVCPAVCVHTLLPHFEPSHNAVCSHRLCVLPFCSVYLCPRKTRLDAVTMQHSTVRFIQHHKFCKPIYRPLVRYSTTLLKAKLNGVVFNQLD